MEHVLVSHYMMFHHILVMVGLRIFVVCHVATNITNGIILHMVSRHLTAEQELVQGEQGKSCSDFIAVMCINYPALDHLLLYNTDIGYAIYFVYNMVRTDEYSCVYKIVIHC